MPPPILKIIGGFIVSTVISYSTVHISRGFLRNSGSSISSKDNSIVITDTPTKDNDRNPNLALSTTGPLFQEIHGPLKALRTEIEGYSATQFQHRVETLLAKRDAFSSKQCKLVVEEWASRYPEEAWAATMGSTEKDTFFHKRFTYTMKDALFDGLLAATTEKALEWIKGQPEGTDKALFRSLAINRLSGTDPEAVFRLIEEAGSPGATYLYGRLLTGALDRDPAKAIEYFARVPKGQAQTIALYYLMSHWVELDPSAALSWAEKLSDPTQKDAALQLYYSSYSELSPEAALDLLKKQIKSKDKGDSSAYLQAGGSILVKLPPAEAEETLALMKQQLSEKDFSTTLGNYARQLSYTNPQRAIDLLAKGEISPEDRESLYTSTLNQWISSDADACLQWMRQHPEELTPKMLMGLKESNDSPPSIPSFSHIMEAAKLLPEGEMQDELIIGLAARWASEDATACFEALDRLPEGKARDRFLSEAMGAMAKTSPEAALAELQRMPKGPQTDAITSATLKSLIDADAKGTLQLMEKQGIQNDEYYRYAFRQWSNVDPLASAKWQEKLPAGTLRDDLALHLIGSLSSKSPPLAAQKAMQIQDPTQREKTLANIGKQWIYFDKAAGKAWVQSAPISAKAKETLLKDK